MAEALRARGRGASALAIVLAGLSAAGCADASLPKNAVLIVLDTLRADRLSAYGNPRETSPVLDRMARGGVLFEEVVTCASWTLPAMVGILAGEYPTTDLYDRGLQRSLVERLRDAGFSTVAFVEGGFVSVNYGLDRGFDHFQDQGSHANPIRTGRAPPEPSRRGRQIELTFERARRWLEDEREGPFFLLVHTYEPHTPYSRDDFTTAEAPAFWLRGGFGIVEAAMVKNGKLPLTAPEIAYIRDLYDGGVATADTYVGGLLETLERIGIAHETLVVVTSDHGEDLGEHTPIAVGNHGHALYDEQLLVPLIVRDPTREYPVGRVRSQVRTVDIMPTVLELLGVPLQGDLHGRSLVPLMTGRESEDRLAWSRVAIVPELRLREQMALRIGRHKLIQRTGTDVIEFYDLDADPREQTSLGQETPLRAELQAKLAELRERLSAPRYEGVDKAPAAVRERLRELGYLE